MITLEIAQAQLSLWVSASTGVAASQSYDIEVEGNRRSLTRADAAEIRKQISYWQGWVTKLSNAATGTRRTRYLVN